MKRTMNAIRRYAWPSVAIGRFRRVSLGAMATTFPGGPLVPALALPGGEPRHFCEERVASARADTGHESECSKCRGGTHARAGPRAAWCKTPSPPLRARAQAQPCRGSAETSRPPCWAHPSAAHASGTRKPARWATRCSRERALRRAQAQTQTRRCWRAVLTEEQLQASTSNSTSTSTSASASASTSTSTSAGGHGKPPPPPRPSGCWVQPPSATASWHGPSLYPLSTLG